MNKSGFFITLEGGEGAGKSTQIPVIKEFFEKKGYEVITLREPGGTPCAEEIRSVLKTRREDDELCDEAELLLMYACRAQLTNTVIKNALLEGKIVICDRYDLSTRAYQGCGRGIDPKIIRNVREAAIGDFAPDLTLLFDLSVEQGMARASKRGAADRIESSGMAFFNRVRDGFLRFAHDDPEHIRIVDASKDIAAVSNEVISLLEEFIR